jgi:hypothetical protein
MGFLPTRSTAALESIVDQLYFANHGILLTVSNHDIYLTNDGAVRVFPFTSHHFVAAETSVLQTTLPINFNSPERLLGKPCNIFWDLSFQIANIALTYCLGGNIYTFIQRFVSINQLSTQEDTEMYYLQMRSVQTITVCLTFFKRKLRKWPATKLTLWPSSND